jgi:hypothetical protein
MEEIKHLFYPQQIETKKLWMAFEEFLDNVGAKRRMEGITSQKFHFSFKQKICQIMKNYENYENAICYSTKEKRIAMTQHCRVLSQTGPAP